MSSICVFAILSRLRISAVMLGARQSAFCLQRTTILLLFAAALMLRVLIPAGWMPAPDAQGFRLTLCTGTGPIDMAAAMTGQGHGKRHDHGQSDTQPCAFAGFSHALDSASAPAPIADTPAMAPVATFSRALEHLSLGLAAPPPLPRGPPACD